jgi:hypothetical protein
VDVNYNSRPTVHAWTVLFTHEQWAWIIFHVHCSCSGLYLFFNPKIFKKIMIFSQIFLPILHNIGLYIYTVKYKFGIKILGFIKNISKKISKHFKKEKNILLHTVKS